MKSRFYASTAFTTAALGLASPALAQQAAAPAPPPAQTEPAPPAATTEETGSDIIVTARRVAERLQDVPLSITVYNQEQIANRNIVVATDLATYTPSLSVNQRFGAEKATFAIRGFNQDIGTAPTVGVYFADVVGVRAQGGTTSGNTVGAGSFMDLRNVQVLKGPQGTLFGRNTTGGAVLLVPNKPSDKLEGFVELQAGNYNMMRGTAVFNIPLTPWLKIRAGVDRNVRQGYMRNRSGIGPKDYNDVDYFYGRFSMVADLGPDIENYTIFHYSNSDPHGRASRNIICANVARPLLNGTISPAAPLNAVGYPSFGNGVDPLPGNTNLRGVTTYAACDQIARQNARGDKLTDVEVSNPDPHLHLKTWQVINTTTWNAADWLTVKNIASYGEFREFSRFNLYSDNFIVSNQTRFFTPAPGTTLPLTPGTPFQYIQLDVGPDNNPNAAEKTMTEELQFQIHSGNLKAVVGGYLEFSRPIGWNYAHTGAYLNCASPENLLCTNPLFIGNISASRTRFAFDNHGVFAQGTYDFNEHFAVTVGARYTFDKIKGQNESTRINFLPGSLGIRNRVCNDIIHFNVPDGPDADSAPDALVVTNPSQCHFELKNSSKKPTWLIDLDYKPNRDILIYAKYARGYRQGGINFTNPGLELWNPEKVDSYEIGAKTTFRAGSVRGYFNVAAFYNNFTNQQVFGGLTAKPTSGLAGGAAIINAGKSTLKGLEVDASANFFTNLRVDLGYTHLLTKIKELVTPTLDPNSPFSAVTPTASVGDPLTFSPKHRLTMTATYTLPLAESLGELSVGGTWVYTSKQIADGGMPAEIGLIHSTNLFNLNINWNKMFGSPLDAAFFMTNVTDKRYSVGTGGGYNSAGFGDINIGLPRMWGVRLRVRMGD
jgi:iron complex outermembrane receptor protein